MTLRIKPTFPHVDSFKQVKSPIPMLCHPPFNVKPYHNMATVFLFYADMWKSWLRIAIELLSKPVLCYFTRYFASDEVRNPRMLPPDKRERPMHCRRVNVQVYTLKTIMAGFSETSLLRERNFFAVCPRGSPPTYSLSLPTDVQSTTIQYFKPFLNAWVEGDVLPSCFTPNCLANAPENTDKLLPLQKESVVFFDGDGGEVRQCPTELRTHVVAGTETMRFRTQFNDAPEASTAFRFYKEALDGRLIPLKTYHAGIESLRAARKTIASCTQVFLEVSDKSSPPPLDKYARRLVNLWVRQEPNDPLIAFPVIMAQMGFTHECPLASERNVQSAIKIATATRSGMRQLPLECMKHPFRPWDVRSLWRDLNNTPDTYQTEFQVAHLPLSVDGEEDIDQVNQGHTFYCKLIRSALEAESFCYPAKSTIPGAGKGLFIRPRQYALPKDTHLCLYGKQSTSEREINEAGSSRVYAIQIGNGKWFDAETDTGENIGRFANQSHVQETLELAVQQADKRIFQRMDWNVVNSYARSKANSHYFHMPREKQLVVRSSREFPPSPTPIEVFTCYGDVQAYWIPLIASQPHLFPPELVHHVNFMLRSEYSNLSDEEKVIHSG